MEYLIVILKLAVIAAAGYVLYKLLYAFAGRLKDKGYLSQQGHIISKLFLKWTILILVILLVLQEIGIDTHHVLTALSAVLVLVAVGFVAVWSVLSNILCSFLLLLFPPFRFGDQIEIKDTGTETGIKGKVDGLNLFYTTLRTGNNANAGQLIRVPNTMFFQRVIICHEGTDTEELKLKPSSSGDHEDEK